MRGPIRVLFALLFLGALGFGAGASVALSQEYPPPPPTDTPPPTVPPPPPTSPSPTVSPSATPRPSATPQNNRCATTGSIRRGKFEASVTYAPGDKIAVRGKSKCARSKASVRLDLDAKKIGSKKASKSGSYTVTGRIPKNTTFGNHTVTVVTSKETYETEIEVEPSPGASASGFSGSAGPLLAAWVALGGVVGAFFVGSRKKKGLVPAMQSAGTDAGDVPVYDTSHFVPLKPKPRKKASAGRSRSSKARSSAKAGKKKPATRKPARKSTSARKKPASAETKKSSGVQRRKPTSGRKPTARKKTAPKSSRPGGSPKKTPDPGGDADK